jgi:hypothetical protein
MSGRAKACAWLRATAVVWLCAGSRPVCGAGCHAPPKAAAHKGISFSAQTVNCQQRFFECRQLAVLAGWALRVLCSLTAIQGCLSQSVGCLQIAVLQQACSSWSQQPVSPAAVKLESGKPEATAPGKPESAAPAAACAARPAAAVAADGSKAAGAAAVETPSPPHAPAAVAPPASGEQCTAATGPWFTDGAVMVLSGMNH